MIDRLQRVDAGHAAKLETQDDGFVVLTSVTHILTNQHKIRPESSAQEWENICSLYVYFNFYFVYSITSFYGLEFFFFLFELFVLSKIPSIVTPKMNGGNFGLVDLTKQQQMRNAS